MYCVNCDWGVGLIKKGKQTLYNNNEVIYFAGFAIFKLRSRSSIAFIVTELEVFYSITNQDASRTNKFFQ